MRLLDAPRSLSMSLEGNRLAREANYPSGLAYSYRNVGFSLMMKGEHQNALKHLQLALRTFVKLRDRQGEGSTQLTLGYCLFRMGDMSEALNALARGHAIFNKVAHPVGLAFAEHAYGMVNCEMQSLDQALKHFQNSEALFSANGHTMGEAYALDGMGVTFRQRGSYGRSLEMHLQALQKFEALQLGPCQAQVLHNLGCVNHLLENHEEAMRRFHAAMQLADTSEERYLELACLTDIGKLFLDLGSVDEAFVVLFKALQQSSELTARGLAYRVHAQLAEAYARQGNWELAYEHHRDYHDLHDTVLNDDARARLRNSQILFANVKAQAETESLRLRLEGLQQKTKELERALEMTNDSIDYARRIQEAMLPGEKTLQAYLPDSFVYFKPRDVVSGDFYWVSEWNDRIILAAVDCTGHGVPGAFMSVLGQSLLNQVVKENYTFIPAKILQAMDQRLSEELGQDSGSEVYDGMEAAVITVSLEDGTLQYAGANIPMYLVNDKGLTCIPAKHTALGGRQSITAKEFHNHNIPIHKGDTIYLFSDGFRDQFGLEDTTRMKYSTKRFQRLLQQMYAEPMERQKEILHQEFETWRGQLKQLDDVMVIGIRF